MLATIVLGDFSGDGHQLTETVYVDITPEVSPDVLYANYRRNVETIKVDPEELVADYEERTIPKTVWNRLVDAGFTASQEDVETGYENGDETNFFVTPEMFVAIIMFFYLNGLEARWEPYQVPAVQLNAFYGLPADRKGPGSLGYGLFH